MGESDNLEDVGYLQDIISYIFDEKKIVTYKWISNVLSIHVNRAKQLLYTFIKHISEERLKELKVTYLVGGILPNDQGCRLQVVSEVDLEKVKGQFKVITSEHIYSITLKNCLLDLQDLCSVDGVKDRKVKRIGALRCLKSIERTSLEMNSKRQEANKVIEDDKKWPVAPTKQLEKEPCTGCKDKKNSKTSNGISSMFAAQNRKKKDEGSAESKKSEEAQKGESASSPETKIPSSKNASKGGKPTNKLAAMFSAQKSKTSKKDIQEENKSKSDKEDSDKQNKPENKSENNSKLVEKLEEKKVNNKNVQENASKTKKKLESKKSKQNKRKASDNEEKNKKRKRIVMMDDSDSSGDDIFGSDDEREEDKSLSQTPPDENDEEEIEDSPEVAAPKDTDLPESQTNGHHCRKRRLVDKTYVDDEGYMVTKKVYEFVSGSESEGEKENEKTTETNVEKTEKQKISKAVEGPQKPQKKENKKKSSSSEKKKQATLMTFFKRS